MCDPVSIAATLAVAQGVQEQKAVDAENEYQDLLYKQKVGAALDTFAALRDRELEERARAGSEIQQITARARQAAGAARLQALESGTGGASVRLLLRDFERSELESVTTVRANLAATARQLRREAVAAGYVSRPPKQFGPFDSPAGLFNLGIQAASAGAQAKGPSPA